MSSSVDSRIVSMKFDNAQFERGVSTTLGTLDKLKQGMNFTSASTGMKDLQSAANGFNLNPLTGAIEGVSKAWVAMTTVAVTALSNITNRAVNAGIQLGKSLTVTPISSGLQEYETNLNSIQTILANTQVSGATLDDVNGALNQLNHYSDKTIYNFSQMARNIGTFTAAGVGLQDSVDSIKGIANLAAVSGSSSEQASAAMYQLSQAIASGRVSLMDWNSVVNAGMGGSVFQRALAQTAVAMGEIDKSAVSLDGKMKNVTINGQSFRDSISTAGGKESWLSSDVLTKTLAQFTGDLSKAELKAQGFNDAQIKAIQKQAEMAVKAATEVKTLSGVIDTARESAGSGWAKTWQLIFGDFNQAKKTFTNLSETINGFIGANAAARNKVLKAWGDLGGRAVLIEGIKNIFEALKAVIEPIHEAFRDIFPPTTGRQLFQLTKAFRSFTEGLILSKDAQEDLHTIFKALFGIIGLGVDVVKGLLGYLFDMGSLADNGAGSLLGLVASVADVVNALVEWIDKGQFIEEFFAHLSEARARVLGPVITFIGKVADAFSALIESGPDAFFDALGDAVGFLQPIVEGVQEAFDGLYDTVDNFISGLGIGSLADIFDFGDTADQASDSIDTVAASIAPLSGAGDATASGWDKVKSIMDSIWGVVEKIASGIGQIFSALKDKFMNAADDLGVEDALAVVNTGFFIAFYIMLRSFIASLKRITDPLGGLADKVSGVLDQVTSNLQTMQRDVQANIILKIAGAIALLAAAIFLLSKIKPGPLGIALGAISIMIGEMVGAMVALNKTTTGIGILGTARMAGIGAAMVGLAASMVIMAGAVALFGQLDMKTIGKGLLAIGVLLGTLTATVAILAKTGGAAAILAVAGGLVILAVGLTMFAGVIKLYEQIDMGSLAEGVGKVAFALIGLGLSLAVFSAGGNIATAASLVVVAVALTILAGALKLMASMSIGDTIQTLVLLGGALLILTLALVAVEALAPAVPLLALLAASLLPFAAAMKLLGSLSWKGVAVALVGLAGALTILGVAAAIFAATGIIFVLPILAQSMLLFGAGLMLAGAGMFLFAAGLASLAVSGAAGFAVLIGGVVSLLELLPLMAQQLGLAMVAFADVLREAAPELANAFADLLITMARAARRAYPEIGKSAEEGIREFLRVARSLFPDIVDTGYALLLALMHGADDHMDEIVDTGASVIARFIRGLGRNSEYIVLAGFDAIIDFMNGIANAIRNRSDEFGEAGGNIADAIVDGLWNALTAAAKETGPGSVIGAGWGLGKAMIGGVMASIDANSPSKEAYKIGGYFVDGLVGGMDGNTEKIKRSAKGLGDNTVNSMRESIRRAKDELNRTGDMNPVITPVLNLKDLENDAKKIRGVMGDHQVGGFSFRQARDISAEKEARAASHDEREASVVHNEYKFDQTINAPKDPDHVTVYRNTKALFKLLEGRDNKS